MKTISDSDSGTGESGRAEKAFAHAFPDKASETVLVQSRTLHVSDPGFRRGVRDVSARLTRTGVVREVRSGSG